VVTEVQVLHLRERELSGPIWYARESGGEAGYLIEAAVFELRMAGIAAVERRGGTADGQIAATRSAGRTIAKVARRRQVRYVVMDDSAPSGLRRVTEGSVTATVRRRLGAGATLELVGPGARIS